MNITGGSARGLKLKVPPGRSLRPTQNQVRLALSSILESSYLPESGWDGLYVADLYAGTGALGIEMLSRGVEHVDFVEKDKSHAAIIRENLEKAYFSQNSTVIIRSVTDFTRTTANVYDLIFLDPPYHDFEKINLATFTPLLKPTGTLIYFHDSHNHPVDTVSSTPPFSRQETRSYGSSAISFYNT